VTRLRRGPDRRRARRVGRAALASALAAVPVAAGLSQPAHAARCTPAKQVGLLLDDSQSMFGLDPARNRLEVAGLLLSKAANRGAPSYAAL
jgi:hypothetical protein